MTRDLAYWIDRAHRAEIALTHKRDRLRFRRERYTRRIEKLEAELSIKDALYFRAIAESAAVKKRLVELDAMRSGCMHGPIEPVGRMWLCGAEYIRGACLFCGDIVSAPSDITPKGCDPQRGGAEYCKKHGTEGTEARGGAHTCSRTGAAGD